MAITKYKGKTLGSALLEGLQGYQSAKSQKEDSFYKNLDTQIKMADLQTKGFVPEMQETPRRVLGLPMGSRKTLAFRYDPTMNAGYQKEQLELQKLQREARQAEELEPLRRKEIADYISRSSGGGSYTSGRMFDPFSNKMINDPRAPKALDPVTRELQQEKIESYRRKAEKEETAKKQAKELAEQSARATLNTAKEIRRGKKYFGPSMGNVPSYLAPSTWKGIATSPLSAGGRNVEFDERVNWEANVDKIISEKVLDVIRNMKSASATGATGMGVLSDKDIRLLERASTALKRNLSPEKAMQYLEDIEDVNARALGGELMVDPEGNRAIVYPDGRVEEI